MPLFGTQHAELVEGQQVQLMTGDALPAGGSTMDFMLQVFALNRYRHEIPRAIIANYSDSNLVAEWSPDGVNYLPILDDNSQPMVAQKHLATFFNLSGAGTYRLTNNSGVDIPSANIWVAL